MSSRFVLPLPSVVLHPLTAVAIAILHIYLSIEHLSKVFRGAGVWTDVWKGFGALMGAYIFAALASRARARHDEATPPLDSVIRADRTG